MSVLPQDLRGWTKLLVKQYGLRAGQRLGQHFLVDKSVLQDIVKTAGLTPNQTVLEVGGGFGVLTLALLEAQAKVVTVELDAKLAVGLRKLAYLGQLTVVEGDILKLSDDSLQQALGGTEFVVVSNLPYEISGAFLRRFLSDSLRPLAITILLQREVAERLTAGPGSMSLLSVLAQLNARVSLVRPVPARSFWPQPKVESALVHMELRSVSARQSLLPPQIETLFWRVVRVGFAARRKQLKNNLLSQLKGPEKVNHERGLAQALLVARISPQARAQELKLEQWVCLTQQLVQLKLLP